MQTNIHNIHNKHQNHDPYARDHSTAIVIYKSNNQDKNHNGGTMQFLASATIGAVTGNGIARYYKINRPIRFKHDAMPILAGTAIPTIISVASGLQPTGLKLLGAGVTSAIIAYSMTPSDPVAEDKKTDNQKADAPKPVPTVSNNPQQIKHPQQQSNINFSETSDNNTQKRWYTRFLFDCFPQPQEQPKQEAKPVPLTAKQIRMQKAREARIRADEEQKQQAEARAKRRAYEQTDEYKEKQRLEAEEKKRAEERAEEESRRASRQRDEDLLNYLRARRAAINEAERREAQRRNPHRNTTQIPIKPSYNMQNLISQSITPQRRTEVNNALDILKPYHKDKAHTMQEIIAKIMPHNSVQSEEEFNATQNKNARTLQNLYHPDKINHLSVPPEKLEDVSKQLSIISGFITNLKNVTYHFQRRDQTE